MKIYVITSENLEHLELYRGKEEVVKYHGSRIGYMFFNLNAGSYKKIHLMPKLLIS